MTSLVFNGLYKRIGLYSTLIVCIIILFLWVHTPFKYFSLFVFTSCKEIDKKYFYTRKNDESSSRLKYEKKLYRFQNMETGKEFLRSLSYLEAIKDEIKKEGVAENELIENEKKLFEKEIKQYDKYKKEHPNIMHIVTMVQDAVKQVFDEVSLKIEQEIKKDRLVKVRNILTGSFLQTNIKEKENMKIKQSIEEKKIKDAVTLSNILNVLSGLKKSLSNSDYDEVLKDEKYLAKKLIRPDITMTLEEFRHLYTGLIEDTSDIQKQTEALHINEEISVIEQQAEALHIDKENNSTAEQPKTINNDTETIDDETSISMSNYCTYTNEICDRRTVSTSCESRINVEDQEATPTCWIFSGLQGYEINHCIETGKDTIYSKQEIYNCANDSERGGNFTKLTLTLIERPRLSDARSYPFKSKKENCTDDLPNVWTGYVPKEKKKRRIMIFKKLLYSMSKPYPNLWIDTLKKHIGRFGSISISVYVDRNFRFSQSGLSICLPRNESNNHALLVTGWTVKNGVPVWIARNTWGHWWGDDGYIYIVISNPDCDEDFEPIMWFYAPFRTSWTDTVREYTVIQTNTREKTNVQIIKQTIKRGESSILRCPMSMFIKVVQENVLKYETSVPEEDSCKSIDVRDTCQNRISCNVFFPPDACKPGYNLLSITYKCKPIPENYQCANPIPPLPSIINDNCRDFCKETAINCRDFFNKAAAIFTDFCEKIAANLTNFCNKAVDSCGNFCNATAGISTNWQHMLKNNTLLP